MLKTIAVWSGLVLAIYAVVTLAQDDAVGPGVGEHFKHTLNATDQNSRIRTLEELMGENGSVVFFVRSADWCPYCQQQLAEVNARLVDFETLGLSVVSVSVDEVDEIARFADEQGIQYTMLADPAGAINEALGIRDQQYPVGSNAFGVPMPVLYLIDTAGIVRLRYMEPTYRTRPDLDIVLRDAAAIVHAAD